LARHDLHALFDTERARAISERVQHSENMLEGTYAILGTDGEFPVLFKDAMHLLSTAYRSLSRLCQEYATMACKIYGLSLDKFAHTTRIRIARYSEHSGEPLSLAPFSRFDRGPVLTVILGEDHACLDISPALMTGEHNAARARLRNGTLIAVDGHARLLCALGMPQEASVRYKLTFLMSMERSLVLDYCTLLRAPILYTPVSQADVVTSRVLPDTYRLTPVYDTANEEWVHKLQELVLQLESSAIVRAGLSAFARAHQRLGLTGGE
jgi:hypothetical protein